MEFRYSRLVPFILLSFLLPGCATDSPNQTSSQADLGRGIVLGTQGFLHAQKEPYRVDPTLPVIEGQVTKIEGGAYLIRDFQNGEIRVAIDQNTTIDRPAHVGDTIRAYLDEHGRAIHILNIEGEMGKDPANP